MKRRNFLELTGVTTCSLLAGCIGMNRAQSRNQKTVSVTDVTQRSDDQPLEFDAEAVESSITEEKTARIRLTYTNTGEEAVEININTDSPAPLQSDGSPGLILLPPDKYDVSKTEGCWEPNRDEFPRLGSVPVTEIEPDKSVEQLYKVWADPKDGGKCIQTGEYRFKVVGARVEFELKIE